jgi:aryl-phospho-beta-D-glucosidase BglC (GH1 family)
VLSHKLPALRTLDNRIVKSEAHSPVRLRGINRSGLEYAAGDGPGFFANAGFSKREFDEIAAWGGNVIRLPFNQARVLDAELSTEYLETIDRVISLAAERGSYTLLDLQWLDSLWPRGRLSSGELNFVPPLPNLASLEVWSKLAHRYCQETAVLYDLFNEPHDPLPDDDDDLNGIRPDGTLFPLRRRRVRFQEWNAWATHLTRAIRNQNRDALIFVSGVDWGYDLHHFPSPDLPGVVYSSHVYPNKTRSWRLAFGNLSKKAPVFIGEFGGFDEHLSWGQELLTYLDARQIGWAAWSWSDHPRLVNSRDGYRPTLFGELVRNSLRHAG